MLIAAGGLLLLGASCQQARKPVVFAAPGTTVEVGHFVGTPLSGPLRGDAVKVVDAKDCLSLKVTWLAMEKMPGGALESLGSRARLIVAERSRRPVLPTTRLTLNALVGPGADVGRGGLRMQALGKLTAALPVGVTMSCRLADPQQVVDPLSGSPTQRYVRLEAHRARDTDGVILALTVQDLVRPSAGEDDFVVSGDAAGRAAAKDAPLELQRETALLDAMTLDKPLAIAVPFSLADTGTKAVAVVVEVDSAPPADLLAKDVATANADLAAGKAEAEPVPLVSSSWSAITAAMGSLSRPELQRPALVFLANETDAPLMADAVLVADSGFLGRLVGRIRDQASAPTTGTALGWALDRATFELLCEMQGQPRMPKELEGVLSVHVGEAARHGSSLDEIKSGLTTRADFLMRLISENQIFLEDSSPAARIRAYDWLVQHDHAPPGYDPLGDSKQRRLALDKFIQGGAATLPATAPASQPAGGDK